jgi:hypothetical protein
MFTPVDNLNASSEAIYKVNIFLYPQLRPQLINRLVGDSCLSYTGLSTGPFGCSCMSSYSGIHLSLGHTQTNVRGLG